MHAKPTTVLIATAVCAVAILIAGCGSSSSNSATTTSTAATGAPASASAPTGGSKGTVIQVADDPDLGQILTDAKGNTVYLFEKDEEGDSYCTGPCASSWPPVTTKGSAVAGQGTDASLLSTLTRDDGTEQVAYAGHPLYLYEGDSKPGDTNGNGLDQFGAEWYALTPAGASAEGSESDSSSGSSDSTSTSSSDYGY
jgi:predicted lipoprotein with Yx(FWY)xxD motif